MSVTKKRSYKSFSEQEKQKIIEHRTIHKLTRPLLIARFNLSPMTLDRILKEGKKEDG